VPSYANPQNLNRFSFVRNNPILYTDPTGHYVPCEADAGECHHDPPPGGGGSGGSGSGGNGGNGGGGDGCRHNDPDCRGDDVGGGGVPNLGGGHPLSSPNLNTDYYQLMTNSLFSGPVLPPSPFACGWFDCILSAASLILSGVTMTGIPAIAGPAVIADGVVTVVATIRTVIDYQQGEISGTRALGLGITGVAGVYPGPIGFAFSAINAIMTGFGFPYP
jgi:hypothetical protein